MTINGRKKKHGASAGVPRRRRRRLRPVPVRLHPGLQPRRDIAVRAAAAEGDAVVVPAAPGRRPRQRRRSDAAAGMYIHKVAMHIYPSPSQRSELQLRRRRPYVYNVWVNMLDLSGQLFGF